MQIAAEISLHPLRQEKLSPAIGAFSKALRAGGLELNRGPVTTSVRGEHIDLFPALQKGLEEAAKHGDASLSATITTAPADG